MDFNLNRNAYNFKEIAEITGRNKKTIGIIIKKNNINTFIYNKNKYIYTDDLIELIENNIIKFKKRVDKI